jgi:hypothetical protein
MSQFEKVAKDLDTKTKEKFLDFLAACDDLENLINRENTMLLDKGAIAFEGISIRKINALREFEESIRNVLPLSKEVAPKNIGLQRILIDRIQEVRRALSINTTFQLRDLKNRPRRMAVLKETLLDFSKRSEEEKGDITCH